MGWKNQINKWSGIFPAVFTSIILLISDISPSLFTAAESFCILSDPDFCRGDLREFIEQTSDFSNFSLKKTYAALADIDNDGLVDFIIAYDRKHSLNAGEMHLHKNLGNATHPHFRNDTGELLISVNLVPGQSFAPGFGDLDGDGYLDMVLSLGSDYPLELWMNRGNSSFPSYVKTSNSSALSELTSEDYSSTGATFADLDLDGDLDMAIVTDNAYTLYDNVGNSTHPKFVKMQRFSNPMYSISGSSDDNLHFVDMDHDGDLDLLSGAKAGVELHENYGSKYTAVFKADAETVFDSKDYDHKDPIIAVQDLNNDGFVDLFVMGGTSNDPDAFNVYFYSLEIAQEQVFTVRSELNNDPFADVYLDKNEPCSVAAADLDGDGDVDLLLGSESLGVSFYENVGGSHNISFVNRSRGHLGLYAEQVKAVPVTGDLDGDGDMDVAISARIDGKLGWLYYENQGPHTNFAVYEADDSDNPFQNITYTASDSSTAASAVLFDLDSDGDLDLVYAFNDLVDVYWNNGTKQRADFQFDSGYSIFKQKQFSDFGELPRPNFAYLDGPDGNLYYVHGWIGSGLNCFEDTEESPLHPVFDLSGISTCGSKFDELGTYQSTTAFTDIDGDGDDDLVVGTSLGLVQFLENGFCTLESECSDQGFCNINNWLPTCTCEENQAGSQCDECANGYYGVDCQQCPLGATDEVCSQRGSCDDGITGSGECSCSSNHFFGDACDEGQCEAGHEYLLNSTTFLYGCSPCAANYYKKIAGNSECTACPHGAETVSTTGLTECTCNLGSYWSFSGSIGSCIDCSSVITNANSGSITTYSTGSISADECVCIEGYYRDGDDCLSCPTEGVNCSDIGTDLLFFSLRPGFWRVSEESASLLACPLGSLSCIGGTGYHETAATVRVRHLLQNETDDESSTFSSNTNWTETAVYGGFDANRVCASSYTGPYCAVCAPGYFKSVRGTCIRCSAGMKTGGHVFVILGAVLGLFALWYLFIKEDDASQKSEEFEDQAKAQTSGKRLSTTSLERPEISEVEPVNMPVTAAKKEHRKSKETSDPRKIHPIAITDGNCKKYGVVEFDKISTHTIHTSSTRGNDEKDGANEAKNGFFNPEKGDEDGMNDSGDNLLDRSTTRLMNEAKNDFFDSDKSEKDGTNDPKDSLLESSVTRLLPKTNERAKTVPISVKTTVDAERNDCLKSSEVKEGKEIKQWHTSVRLRSRTTSLTQMLSNKRTNTMLKANTMAKHSINASLTTIHATLVSGADEHEVVAAMRNKIKIILVCHQILVQFPSILQVEIPPNFSSYLGSFSIVQMDVMSMLSWTCLATSTFYSQLLVITISPIIFCILLYLTYVVHNRFSKRTDLGERYYQIFFALTFVMFGSVSTKVFQTFLCETFDDGSSYLKADFSVSCQTETYSSYYKYALFMLIIYPFGIPALYLVELFRNRRAIIALKTDQKEEELEVKRNTFADQIFSLIQKRKNLFCNPLQLQLLSQIKALALQIETFSPRSALSARNKEDSQSKHSELKYIKFLYEPYDKENWWFAVVECIRRLTLSGLLVFFKTSSTAQVIYALLISMFWLIVFIKRTPYQQPEDNYLEQYLGIIIFLTMFAALMVDVGLSSSDAQEMAALGYVLITLDCTILILGLLYFLCYYFFPKIYHYCCVRYRKS